jgi:hypothetical protein
MKKRNFLLALASLLVVFLASAQGKPRVYVVDRDEWELTGGFNGDVGNIHAGVRRDYTETLKTFAQACVQVTFTGDRAKADYAVVLDRKIKNRTNPAWGVYQNDFVIFNRAGDVIYSGSTLSLKNAAKDSCKALVSASKKTP